MALSCPDGLAYFKRSVLHSSYFDANNQADFYTYFLVEMVQNNPYITRKHGAARPSDPSSAHPRTPYTYPVSRHRNCEYDQGQFDVMTISYGTLEHPGCRWKVWLNTDSRQLCEGYDGYTRVCYVPVKMPNKNERYFYIDRTAAIRAVYLPLKFESDPAYPDLCCYIGIDFRIKKDIAFLYREGSSTSKIYANPHSTQGLITYQAQTICFDTKEIYNLMSIPDGLRDRDRPLFYPSWLVSLTGRDYVGVSNDIDFWASVYQD